MPHSVKSRDIRTFLTRFLPIQSPDVGYSSVSSMSEESVGISDVSYSHDYRTRTDRVRSEHDRGKKKRSVRF